MDSLATAVPLHGLRRNGRYGGITEMSHLLHEKIIYRYISALEQGDFETLTTILQQAEQDPELETMLWEVSKQYGDEYEQLVQTSNIAAVEQLIQEHLPSAKQADMEVVTAYENPTKSKEIG